MFIMLVYSGWIFHQTSILSIHSLKSIHLYLFTADGSFLFISFLSFLFCLEKMIAFNNNCMCDLHFLQHYCWDCMGVFLTRLINTMPFNHHKMVSKPHFANMRLDEPSRVHSTEHCSGSSGICVNARTVGGKRTEKK